MYICPLLQQPHCSERDSPVSKGCSWTLPSHPSAITTGTNICCAEAAKSFLRRLMKWSSVLSSTLRLGTAHTPAQMAFSEYGLFNVSGRALLLAPGQSAPPTAQAHRAAPHQPCRTHQHISPRNSPHTQREGSFLHKPQLTSCFNSPKSDLLSQNVLASSQTSPLPHYKVQLEPLNTAQSKTPMTCTGSSLPFWRYSTSSITSLLANTAQDFGSHCHSHL